MPHSVRDVVLLEKILCINVILHKISDVQYCIPSTRVKYAGTRLAELLKAFHFQLLGVVGWNLERSEWYKDNIHNIR